MTRKGDEMTSVDLIGYIANDFEVKELKNEGHVLSLNVAVHHYQQTSFIPVVVWNRIAVNMGKYCQKGDKIGIVGYLKQDFYTSKDGKKHSRIVVVAISVEFLTPRDADDVFDEEWEECIEEKNIEE